MATPHGLSSSTWRVLGLSVAASYVGLGLMDVFTPNAAANLLAIWPTQSSTMEAEELIEGATILLGARDLSIGVALFAFDYYRMPRSMGILIMSGLVLCSIDVVWMWKAKGTVWGVSFGIGATIWAWIGWNLLKL